MHSILADVPCSGDGTTRKSPDIWKQFGPDHGFTLHPTQLAIASRGISMLKIGGLLVYSTCSLNPVENEAVVAQLLRSYKGAVELVDAAATLPLLKRRPGISSWKVGCYATDKVEEKAKVDADATPADAAAADTGVADAPAASDVGANAEDKAPKKVAVLDGAAKGVSLVWLESQEHFQEQLANGDKKLAVRKIPNSAWPPTKEEVSFRGYTVGAQMCL